MKSLSLDVSPLVLEFLDKEAAQEVLEAEARRLWHCWRSRELSPKEKELRSFIGKEAYNRLNPKEHARMLACVELPK